MKMEKDKSRHRKSLLRSVTVGLRTPIMILLVLFGMVPMLVGTQVVISSARQNQIDSRMSEVQMHCRMLSARMTRARYLAADVTDASLDREIETVADVYNGRIVIVNSGYRIVKDTFHISENRFLVAEEILRCFQGENSSRYHADKNYFAQTFPIYNNAESQDIDGVLLITASTEGILSVFERVGDKVLLLEVLALLLLIVCAALAARVMVNPFWHFQKKLDQVAAGALDTDLTADIYQETRNISRSVEKTIGQLREVDQSRQEFVSNVSHELKTPITSIRVFADSLMSMEEAPVDLYREFMEDISVEIDRESKIIDDLLTLVKMDKSEAILNITQVNVNLLVEQTLKRLRPLADKRHVELIYESIREVTADIDEMKISLAVSNIVENATKYNVEGGWVRVTVDADHKFFYVKVADSGIGIPEEEQGRIFERFYRVDKARSRETGGTGLGLSITRNVVLMHRGAIKLSSQEGEGSVFTLRIPLNYIAQEGERR